ncbi:MAG: putative Ig domain-containing protein, partial [Synergistaceae bacterium]|nr:putative Ig domain-containing protein [Synergistaceae bacterium]
ITIASADAPGLPIILTTSLASGTRGIAYTASLSAAGAPTISWSLTSGDLPGGLTLSTSGDISGTPTTAGTFTFTVQAVNSVGSASRSFTITIAAPTLPGSPTITTTSLSSGTSGTAYSAVLTATGTTPITWSVTSGSLPTGLTLSSAGVISGTPTATGRYTFTVTAQNSAGSASRQLTLRIVAASSGGDTSTTRTAPTISTSSVSAGTAGSSYTYTLTASGSTPIIWSLVSGSLPSGLRLSSSGVISGTPTTTGTFTFVVQARNTAGSVTQSLTLTVNAASSSAVAPSISTSSLPDATEGTSYTANLTATGTTPITWRVGSGSLPSGLTLSSSGTISGTPAESGIFRFSVNAENSAGTDSKTFTLTVEAASGPAAGTAPSITVSVQPVSGKVGVLYSFTLQAQGTAPITWRTTDGSLPLGLGLSSNGTISGTPTFAGEYMFGVEAVNEWGTSSATFTIKIASEAGEVVEVDDIVRGPARTVADLSEEDLAVISGDLIAAVM